MLTYDEPYIVAVRCVPTCTNGFIQIQACQHTDRCTHLHTDTHLCMQDSLKDVCVDLSYIRTSNTSFSATNLTLKPICTKSCKTHNNPNSTTCHQYMNASTVPEHIPTCKPKSTGTCTSPHHAYITEHEPWHLS